MQDATIKGKIDTLLLGIFTAVLPVFATRVGTVIAFYFTDASFRLAAQTAREATAAAGETREQKVTDQMILYGKIGKLEKVDEAAARATKWDEVAKLFNDQTTRVIIFTEKGHTPLFILRNKAPMRPADWKPDPDATVATYLALRKENETDAKNFEFISETATLERAREKMTSSKCKGLFVTKSGSREESVLGWVTDDILKPTGPTR